jgi:hypothetical protein
MGSSKSHASQGSGGKIIKKMKQLACDRCYQGFYFESPEAVKTHDGGRAGFLFQVMHFRLNPAHSVADNLAKAEKYSRV